MGLAVRPWLLVAFWTVVLMACFVASGCTAIEYAALRCDKEWSGFEDSKRCRQIESERYSKGGAAPSKEKKS